MSLVVTALDQTADADGAASNVVTLRDAETGETLYGTLVVDRVTGAASVVEVRPEP